MERSHSNAEGSGIDLVETATNGYRGWRVLLFRAFVPYLPRRPQSRTDNYAACRFGVRIESGAPKHLRLPDRRRRGPGHLLLEDNPPVFEEAALRGAPRCRRAVDVAGGRRDAARRAAWRVPTRPMAARSGWTRVTRRACVGLSPPLNRADKCKRAVRRGAACRARPPQTAPLEISVTQREHAQPDPALMGSLAFVS